MPVVPRMDSPPRMPRRGFQVERAIAVVHRDLDLDVAGAAVPGRDRGDVVAHHLAWHGVDGRFADRERQPGPGHRADARTGPEDHSAAGRQGPYRGPDQRAMGHIRVVARVLDDRGHGMVRRQLLGRERERGPLPLGQFDGHRIGEIRAQQRGVRGRRRGGRTRPGGPAVPQPRPLQLGAPPPGRLGLRLRLSHGPAAAHTMTGARTTKGTR
ncbi:hypothetical protein SANTM175S_00348 [Streptomyces antimycoticus]